MSREQKLIDIMFQVVVAIETNRDNWVEKVDLIDWTKEQLKHCGFEISAPIGCSYGLLVEPKEDGLITKSDFATKPCNTPMTLADLFEAHIIIEKGGKDELEA